MIEIRLLFNNYADAGRAMALLDGERANPILLGAAAPDAPPKAANQGLQAAEAEKPKRTRKVKAETTELDKLATQQPAVDLFAETPAPVVAPVKAPEQKDLIAACRKVYEKSAADLEALIKKFGVAQVNQIPKDKWAQVIAEAQKIAP